MSNLLEHKHEGSPRCPTIYLEDYVHFTEMYLNHNKKIMAYISLISHDEGQQLKDKWWLLYQHFLSGPQRLAEHLLHEPNFELYVIFASDANRNSQKAVAWCNCVDEALKKLMSTEYFDHLQVEIEGASPDEWEVRDWRDWLFTHANEMQSFADFIEKFARVFQQELGFLALRKKREVEAKEEIIRKLDKEKRDLKSTIRGNQRTSTC